MISKISIENKWNYTFANLPRMGAAHIQFYAIVWGEHLNIAVKAQMNLRVRKYSRGGGISGMLPRKVDF